MRPSTWSATSSARSRPPSASTTKPSSCVCSTRSTPGSAYPQLAERVQADQDRRPHRRLLRGHPAGWLHRGGGRPVLWHAAASLPQRCTRHYAPSPDILGRPGGFPHSFPHTRSRGQGVDMTMGTPAHDRSLPGQGSIHVCPLSALPMSSPAATPRTSSPACRTRSWWRPPPLIQPDLHMRLHVTTSPSPSPATSHRPRNISPGLLRLPRSGTVQAPWSSTAGPASAARPPPLSSPCAR